MRVFWTGQDMRRGSIPAAAIIATFLAILFSEAMAADIAGSHDHPLVGRYEGSSITYYKASAFDQTRLLNHALPNSAAERLDDSDSLSLEGKVTTIRYDAPSGRSPLEIIRNYQTALAGKGFSTVYSCSNEQCLSGDTGYFKLGWLVDSDQLNYRYQQGVQYALEKATLPSGDVYAAIAVGDAKDQPPIVRVTVVEMKPMDTGKIAFVTASQMAQAIGQSGSVALYGIQFDFDKADIEPESKPTLDEIAKFLNANPNISLVVAGHTDSQGGFDYNVDLSKRRAQAVANELVKSYGIAAARLTPFGAGMAAPIASNSDEAGRAKNRRVELVER